MGLNFSVTSTTCLCELDSDGNEKLLQIFHSSSTTGASPLDCVMSYTGYSFRGTYISRDALSVFYSPSWLAAIRRFNVICRTLVGWDFFWILERNINAYSGNWGCRIHPLFLCRGLNHPPQRVSRYDIKQSGFQVPVKQELSGMQCTLSLLSLLDPQWPRLVAPDRVRSRSRVELNSVLMLNWITWNRTVWHLNVYKQRQYLYKT